MTFLLLSSNHIDLRIKRTDENGNILKEFNADVILGNIDRVAWIALDLDLGGALCTGSECIEYTTKVSEDKETGEFIYYFDFSSTHSKAIILQSPLFDLLIGEKTVRLESMSHLNFVHRSYDFPVASVPAPMKKFINANDDPHMLKYFMDNYPDINSEKYYYKDSDDNLWLNTSGTSNYFFVQSKWRDVLVKENEKFWER